MAIQNLLNGPIGITFLLTVARLLPPAAGYRLAELLGRYIARQQSSPVVQAVRTNQWVVSGCTLSKEELDQRTEAVFIYRGRYLYENYHYYHQQGSLADKIQFAESFLRVIEHSQKRDAAQLLLMPHVANYDLVSVAAARRGLTAQVLSYPKPGISYRLQNRYRNEQGYMVTPISVSALRSALKNLEQGGTVLTGIDRPYGDFSLHPRFFGKASNLPTGYIRLALKSRVPAVVLGFHVSSEGVCTVSAADPIPVLRDEDPLQEQRINLSRVLNVVEDTIRTNPEFWFMFYPVWPDLIKDTP